MNIEVLVFVILDLIDLCFKVERGVSNLEMIDFLAFVVQVIALILY